MLFAEIYNKNKLDLEEPRNRAPVSTVIVYSSLTITITHLHHTCNSNYLTRSNVIHQIPKKMNFKSTRNTSGINGINISYFL